MKIKLDDEWFIEDVGLGYTLIKASGKTQEREYKGKVTETLVYDVQIYPPTIEDCLKQYARYKIIEKHELITLQEYAKEFRSIYADLKEKVSDLV